MAADTVELYKAICEESRGGRILVNSVEKTDYCDLIFHSYMQKGDLTITFSTGKFFFIFKTVSFNFENTIPDSVGEFSQQIKSLHSVIPKDKEGMQYFDTLVEEYLRVHFK